MVGLKKLPEMVIREVAANVWTFSCPFARLGLVPLGGRSTAIKLSNGQVWVLASTPMTDETKETIDRMGPVKWLMAGDKVHHLFLKEFKDVYPSAMVIGVEDLPKQDFKLDGAYGVDPPETKYGFEDEIKAQYFSGYINKDVAWYHIASKSLIVADLFFNLPPTEQYSRAKASGKIPFVGTVDGQSSIIQSFLNLAGTNKSAMQEALKAVDGWDFERIIMCHGDVLSTNAKAQWKAAYSKYA